MSEAVLSRTAAVVVDYPTSDGKPVAETDLHFDRVTYVAHGFKAFYAHRPDAYVGANLLVHYVPGNRRRHVAPDVFVAFGVPNHRRDRYLLWEEATPAFVLEITSESTRKEDQGSKRLLYAQWGVAEYFQYDPRQEYLQPALQGFRLRDGSYRPIAPTPAADGLPGVHSESLGLHFRLRGLELRICDPATGRELLTHAESERAREAAEARVARLEAELRKERQPRRPD